MKCLFLYFLSAFCLEAVASFSSIGQHAFVIDKFKVSNPEDSKKELDAIMTRPQLPIQRASLIVLLPGYGIPIRQYQYYADHLASHGFHVVGFDFLKNRSAMDGEHPYKVRQVQFLLREVQKRYSLTLDEIGVFGHSQGGKIAFMLALADSRIKTVMAMDPVNAGGPPCFVSPRTCALYPVAPNPSRGHLGSLRELVISSLIMRSAPDRWLNPEAEFNAERFFFGSDNQGTNGTPAPSIYFDMGSRSHAAYLPSRGGITVEIAKRTAAAWFDQHLREGMNWDYLTGSIILRDLELGHFENLDSRF